MDMHARYFLFFVSTNPSARCVFTGPRTAPLAIIENINYVKCSVRYVLDYVKICFLTTAFI
jgi:hypothetical protein